jgi:hypothetical protein
MGVRVPETLSATIDVQLVELQGSANAPIFEGHGQYAGLEVVGEVERLVS